MPVYTQAFTLVASSVIQASSPFSADFSAEFAPSNESPDGTKSPPALSILGSTITGQPTISTFTWTITGGQQIAKDGVLQTVTHQVILLAYHNHTLYQENSALEWYYWDTVSGGWPQYLITGVACSGSTYAVNAPANTVIGNITTSLQNNEVFDGVYAVSDNTNFKIVGNQLQANAILSQTSYSITLTATPNVIGQPFTSATLTLSQQGTITLIPYGTSAPTTLPTAVGAVSPLGWTVDFFDDFNGTFTKNSPAGWSTGGFTTGATYRGLPAQYGAFWNTTGWGGYGPQLDTINNISMSNSRLIFQGTLVSGTPNVASCVMNYDTTWGYWEVRMKMAAGFNGSNTNIGNGIWLNGSQWPTSGEFDAFELINGGNGWQTFIHCNTAVGTDARQVATSGPLPAGGTVYDGTFRTFGVLITPSYLANYIDGVRTWTGAAAGYLKNLTTATNPPQSTASGSFGWHSTTAYQTTLTLNDWAFQLIFGLNWQGTASAAQFPMQAEVDWVRHSQLNPATGGPHF